MALDRHLWPTNGVRSVHVAFVVVVAWSFVVVIAWSFVVVVTRCKKRVFSHNLTLKALLISANLCKNACDNASATKEASDAADAMENSVEERHGR